MLSATCTRWILFLFLMFFSRVLLAISAPTLNSPKGNPGIIENDPYSSCMKFNPVTGAANYKLQIGLNASFSSRYTKDISPSSVNSCHAWSRSAFYPEGGAPAAPYALNLNQIYYWRVLAEDGNGNQATSTASPYKILPTTKNKITHNLSSQGIVVVNHPATIAWTTKQEFSGWNEHSDIEWKKGNAYSSMPINKVSRYASSVDVTPSQVGNNDMYSFRFRLAFRSGSSSKTAKFWSAWHTISLNVREALPKPTFQNIEDIANSIDFDGQFKIVWSNYAYSGTSFSLWHKKNNTNWVKHTELVKGYGWPTVAYGNYSGDQQGDYRFKLQYCENSLCIFGPESDTVTFQLPPPTVSVGISLVTENVTNPNTAVIRLSLVGSNATHYVITETNVDNPAEVNTQTVNHWSPGPVISGWGNKNSSSSWRYSVKPCYNTTCGNTWNSGVIKVELPDIDETGLGSSLIIGGVNPATHNYCIIPKGKTTCHDQASEPSSYVDVKSTLASQYANENICLYRNNVELGCRTGYTLQQRTYDTTTAVDTYEVRVKQNTGRTTPFLRKRFRGFSAATGSVTFDTCNILSGQNTCSSQIHWTRDNNYVQTCLFAGTAQVETNNPLQCWEAGITSGSYPIELSYLPDDYYVASSEVMPINQTMSQYVNTEILGEISAAGFFEGITLTAGPNPCYADLPETSCQTRISWETTEQPQGCLFKNDGELLFCGQQGNVETILRGTTDFYLREFADPNSQVLGSLRVNVVRRGSATFTVNDLPCEPGIDQDSCVMSVTVNYFGDHAHLFKDGVSWGDYGPSAGSGTDLQMNLTATNGGTLYELRESSDPTSHLMGALTLYTANFESNGYGIEFANDNCEIAKWNNHCFIPAELIAPEQPSGDKVCIYVNNYKLGCHSHDNGMSFNATLKNGKNIFQLRVEANNELVAQRVVYATSLPYSEITSEVDECEISAQSQQDEINGGPQATCSIKMNWHWDCSNNPDSEGLCQSNQKVCLYMDDVLQQNDLGQMYCSEPNIVGEKNEFQFEGVAFNFNQEKEYLFELREEINGVVNTTPLASKTVSATKAFVPVAELTVEPVDPQSNAYQFTATESGGNCTINNGDSCPVIIRWRTNITACITKSTASWVNENDPENLACTVGQTPDAEGNYTGNATVNLLEGVFRYRMLGAAESGFAAEKAVVQAVVGLPLIEVSGLTIQRIDNSRLQVLWPKPADGLTYRLQKVESESIVTDFSAANWQEIDLTDRLNEANGVMSFIDTAVTPNKHYYYRIKACNGATQCQ